MLSLALVGDQKSNPPNPHDREDHSAFHLKGMFHMECIVRISVYDSIGVHMFSHNIAIHSACRLAEDAS